MKKMIALFVVSVMFVACEKTAQVKIVDTTKVDTVKLVDSVKKVDTTKHDSVKTTKTK